MSFLHIMKKDEKSHIFELFRKGLRVVEIAKTSKINLRTLYRWHDEFKEEQRKAAPPPTVTEIIEHTRQRTESQLEIDFAENWLSVASKQSIKHCIINGQIAKALSNILINEIQQKDINYRALSALSSSIAIHSKLHRDYGQFHLLDGNKAIEMLTSQGYIISEIVKD